MTTQKRTDNEGSIFFDSKRNRWVAAVTVGYDKETGKRLRKVHYRLTRREATEELKKLREQFGAVSYYDGDKLTLGQWCDRWYHTYVEQRLRENSRRPYLHVLRIAKENLGSIPLTKVTPSDLQNLIFTRMRDHYRLALTFRKILRAVFRRAIADKLLHDNPAEFLDLPKKPPQKKFVQPTDADWEALINAATPYYYWRMLMLTEYMTGMRRSELLGLRWQDIDIHVDRRSKRPTSGKIHICHALILGMKDPATEHCPLILANPKSRESNRVLTVPAEYCRELLSYRIKQAEIKLRSADWEENDFVFSLENGKPVSPQVISTAFARLCKKLGIQSTFHHLRHDMACRMKQSRKFDIKDIQAQLGHSNVSTTLNFYTHIGEEDKDEVCSWLGEGLSRVVSKNSAAEKNF